MSAPTIIAGPAIITHNSRTYYTESDIVVSHSRETFNVVTALAGTIDERLVSQMAEIKFKPVGALDVVAKYLPYAASQIGTMLINQASPKTVVIWGADGVKQTWANGFVSALPTFILSATKTAIASEMTITVFGDPTVALDAAAAWVTTASAALADTSFDETKIVTPQYTATWGTTFTAIESEDGFTVEPVMTTSVKKVDNWGNLNAMLTDLTVGVRFKPVGITEASMWSALALQNTGAKKPGQSLSSADDLVISGGSITFTQAKAGMKSAVAQYGLQPLRLGEVVFVNRKTWTTGAINALFTMAFS